MKTLALDMATKTGWALHDDGVTTSGVWNFDSTSVEGPVDDPAPRWLALRRKLEELNLTFRDRLVMESGFHRGAASYYLTGFQVVAEMYAREYGLAFMKTPPMTLKRHFADVTGIRASKDTMLAAARERWDGVFSDDEADALWLLDYALKQRGN